MKEKLSKLIGGMNKAFIIVLLLLSAFTIISPFFMFHSNKDIFFLHYFEIHSVIRRLFSFIILIVAWKLYKRTSAAWTITMVALSMIIFEYLIVYHNKIFSIWFLITITIFFVLMFSKNYYCRKTNLYHFRKSLVLYLFYVVFIILNASIGFFHLKRLKEGMVPFYVCIKQTFEVMFDTDNLTLIFSQNMMYHRFIFWFSWISIIIGIILFLTPYISEKIQTQDEMEKARELVKKYGQNCSSYLTLEKGMMYYFGKYVEGFVAYGIVKDTVVVLGEPMCASEHFTILLSEFKNFCRDNAFNIIVLNTTSMFLKEYKSLGMGMVKCGEEPRIYLKDYSLAGGNASKVRLNINHATKAGITILEYEPLKGRTITLEKEIQAVSQEWFSMKKSSELVFTMGSIGFENPMERRYFYAVNQNNEVEGFIVFVPFAGMNGYMADVTRHRVNATRGVMEKIFYEAMMKFKDDGFEWGSLAVAPLARLEEEQDVPAKFLNIIYEKMNHVYGFKTLYNTKVKYNPTCWEPSYYVFYPPVFTPALAYAIIRIQNPMGIKDYMKAFFRNMKKEKSQCKINQENKTKTENSQE